MSSEKRTFVDLLNALAASDTDEVLKLLEDHQIQDCFNQKNMASILNAYGSNITDHSKENRDFLLYLIIKVAKKRGLDLQALPIRGCHFDDMFQALEASIKASVPHGEMLTMFSFWKTEEPKRTPTPIEKRLKKLGELLRVLELGCKKNKCF